MRPGDWFLVVVGILYVGASLSYWFTGQKAMSLVLFSYAVANFALIVSTK